MPLTFDQSKDEIAQRVRQFSINRDQYRAASHKEAHARQEFIDPLFAALGCRRRRTPAFAAADRRDRSAD